MASRSKSQKQRIRGAHASLRIDDRKGGGGDSYENVHRTKIRVIGIGGGGGNIVSEVSGRVLRFDFIGANTDTQALRELSKKIRAFPFGQEFTQGLGCGMDADTGERAAKAEKERIKKLLEGSDVCILIATLGGGTGSGATAVFAEVAQELRILTIGIFTMPFRFEGERRTHVAETALAKIKPFVNAYVVIPNEYIFRVVDQKTPLRGAFSSVNKRLAETLGGFMETIALPGLINIDFADLRSTLEGRGRLAYIQSAEAKGATKAQEVVQAVLGNPLYGYGIEGTDRILFNITGDKGLKMREVALISSSISSNNPKARVVFGVACNSKVKDSVRVTLLAVGCESHEEKKPEGPKSENKKRKTVFLKKKKRSLPRLTNEGQAEEKGSGGLQEPEKDSSVELLEAERKRRNAMEVKKAVDEEMKELEEKERQWDIPSFMRNK